jgi:hypothetical protein
VKSLIAAGVLVLAGGLLSASASAEEGSAGTAGAAAADPGACTPAQFRRLERAGDNFSDVCFQPGAELAGVRPVEPKVRSGEIDRSRMRLIGHVPLAGDFEGQVGSDLAFQGRYAYVGNYQGFAVYDIARPNAPRRIAQVSCPGSQNDISVYGDILVLSVDSTRSNDTCDNEAVPGETPVVWEGVRVFDISNPRTPEFLTSVKTECGSHTHTLAPSKNGKQLFVYVSSYGPSPATLNCQPPHDLISVVRVPVARPEAAAVVNRPVLFPGGGNDGEGYSAETSGCHDITAYPRKDLAAGACMGDGILLDISDRARPRLVERVRDNRGFAFWHSATFNNAGTKVVFTDELGGGGSPTCNAEVGKNRGANGIYDIVKRGRAPQLVFKSYYKIPRVNSNNENCVAHNGSLIPVKGRDIMVQAWYQGGQSIFDFTDSRHPVELAHFDRGAISDEEFVLGGTWSSYWYNGHVYSSDITRGLEVFEVTTRWAEQAAKVRMGVFNAQSQPSYNG